MSNVKIENIQQVYLNGKKASVFNVYSFKNGVWIFDNVYHTYGWYKKESTLLKKHTALNAKY